MEFKKMFKKAVLFFTVMSLVIAANVTFAFAEDSDIITVTFDAGYGRFNFFGGPHTQVENLTIGETYPENLFRTDMEIVHRSGFSCDGWFYYTDNHEKVILDENSLVTVEGDHVYANWKALDPDTCSSILFKGSSSNHKDFEIKFYNN